MVRPAFARVSFQDGKDVVSCGHVSGLCFGVLNSGALKGSAHARLIKLSVSKTIDSTKLFACRSDLCCHHFHSTQPSADRVA